MPYGTIGVLLALVLLSPGVPGIHSVGGAPPVPVATATAAVVSGVGAYPVAPRMAGAPSPLDSSEHWWDGAEYDGTATTATSLFTYIQVPDDLPDDSSNIYYVLLSAWDNAGSYDQIGVAAWDGGWGLLYSWTSACAGTYHYTPDAYGLTRGSTYGFEMTIASGTVTFELLNSGGGIYWSLNAATGGTAFEVDETYTCSSSTYGGLTDYEEAYTTTQTMPSYSFPFDYNKVGGASETNWTAFDAASSGTVPTTISVGIAGATVTIQNQAFNLSFFHGGLDHQAVAQGSTSLQKQVMLYFASADGSVALTSSCLSSGWSASFSPASGTSSFMSVLTVTLPASAALGTYCVRILATDNSGIYTRLLLNVTVETPLTASAPHFSPHAVDVGQITTISTVAYGGSGTYTYYWSGVPTGCHAGQTSSFLCAPSSQGSYRVNVNVTDSSGLGAGAGPSTLVVWGDPSTTTPLANRTSVDVGQPIGFSTVASGGNASWYTYTWSETYPATGCVLANASSITCVPTSAGSPYVVSVNVSDANGYSSPVSSSSGFTVYADLNFSTPAAKPGVVDAGGTLTLTSVENGGSGGATPQWLGLPTGCSSSGTLSVVCTPSGSGTSHVRVQGEDSNGFYSESAVLVLVVLPVLNLGALTDSRASADVGQEVDFSIAVSGGTGVYTYTWSGLPLGCAGGNLSTIDCVPAQPEAFDVQVSVSDTSGASATSTAKSVLVSSDPEASTPQAVPASLDLGMSTTLSTTTSGGAGTLTVVWSGLPAGCSGDTSTIPCTPTAPGNFSVQVSVSDANGWTSKSAALLLVVSSDPTVSLRLSPATLDLGERFEAAAQVNGGSGGGSYLFGGLTGSGCAAPSGATLSCVPTSAGTFTLNVTYADSNGERAVSSGEVLTVEPSLAIASFTATPLPDTAGGSVSFSTTVTGGWPAYTYRYAGLPETCPTANSSTIPCVFGSVGTFDVTLTVSDRAGAQVNRTVVVNVVAPPSGGPWGFLGTTLGLSVIALAVIVVAVVAAALLVSRRRRRSGAQVIPSPSWDPTGPLDGTGGSLLPPPPPPPT